MRGLERKIIMEDTKTQIRKYGGRLLYYRNGKKTSEVDYDLHRYYDTMCKCNWDNIVDAAKDYWLSREWN